MPIIVFDKIASLYEQNREFVGEVKIGIVPGQIHLSFFGELKGNQILKLQTGQEIVIKAFIQDEKNASHYTIFSAV